MSKIRVVARFSIHSGKTEEFKRIAAECLQLVQTKDTGTFAYEWFMNDAQSECVVLEAYDGAEALLAHTDNVGPMAGKLFEVSHCVIEIYGKPPDQMMSALKGLPITLFERLQGLD